MLESCIEDKVYNGSLDKAFTINLLLCPHSLFNTKVLTLRMDSTWERQTCPCLYLSE